MRILFILFLLSGFQLAAQESFTGKLVYKVELEYPDTNVVQRKWFVTVYTNDTIVRTETTNTQFGDQVYIRHMELNKAYLLLNVEGTKYAIQNDLSKKADTLPAKYVLKKAGGHRKIQGIKAKRYKVTYSELKDKPFYIWVAKKLKGSYIEAYSELNHLPLEYVIPTEDGIEHYTLIGVDRTLPDRNLFGLPSDYKRVSFDEFMHLFTEEKE